MLIAAAAVVAGLALLVWSADKFIEGAAVTARYFGMPALLIGMVIVGFGTSAPELVVSLFAAVQGNSGIALGNAYGSNIANIALILGVTALIHPVAVNSRVLRKELPILTVVTLLAAWQVRDGNVSAVDAAVLLIVFVGLAGWSIWQGTRSEPDALGKEIEDSLAADDKPLKSSITWLLIGLAVLIASSRLLVWGAVEIASALGVSDLIIGLTVVAIGTSLPELASSIIATRKGEHDIALGNIVGSNLFNTLMVVGLAGIIRPMEVGAEVFSRDMLVMTGLTISLFVIGYGFRRPGKINRWEGGALLTCFICYTTYLVAGVVVQ